METIEDVFQALDSIHAKYSPSELQRYCFEYACRLIEHNKQNPVDYHQGYYETIIVGEAKKLYDQAVNIYVNGYKPVLRLPYTGVTTEWVKKLQRKSLN